uniref:Uncharacterized protein n=1 Tax=Cacopsylla melanoneura TaxID=428564 RepID=A0A8D9BCF8_9HEMI
MFLPSFVFFFLHLFLLLLLPLLDSSFLFPILSRFLIFLLALSSPDISHIFVSFSLLVRFAQSPSFLLLPFQEGLNPSFPPIPSSSSFLSHRSPIISIFFSLSFLRVYSSSPTNFPSLIFLSSLTPFDTNSLCFSYFQEKPSRKIFPQINYERVALLSHGTAFPFSAPIIFQHDNTEAASCLALFCLKFFIFYPVS